MAYFEFPHTRSYDGDLGYIIKKLQELTDAYNNFFDLNKITFHDPIYWDITEDYIANTIVYDPKTATLYISRDAVPAGIDITNRQYWVIVSPFKIETEFSETSINPVANRTITAKFNLLDADIAQLNAALAAEVAARTGADTSINNNINVLTTNLATETSTREHADTLINARIDEIISGASVDPDAELLDIRIGANGETYPTAGDAVRGQVEDLETDIKKSTGFIDIDFTSGYAVLTNVAIGEVVNLTPVTSADRSYAIVECEPGDKFLLNGNETASYIYIWSFVDKDDKLLSRATARITAYNLLVTAPANAVKCVLNFLTASMGSNYYGGPLPFKVADIEDDITDIQSDINDLQDIEKLYTNDMIYGGTVEENTYYAGSNGAKSTNASFFAVSHAITSAVWGQRIWSYSSYVPDIADRNAARSVVFFDVSNNYLGGYEPYASYNQHDAGYVIPENAVKMVATFYYVDSTTKEKPATYWVTTTRGLDQYNYLNKDIKVYTSTLINDGMSENISDFIKARRPTICFILDGNYSRNDDIVEIAEAHGYRIGIAPKYNTSFYGAEGSDNFAFSVDQYLTWQNNGHEILSHMNYDLPEDPEYSDEQCIAYIKESYFKMVERGFFIKGAIGSSGKVADRFIPYVENWYSYGSTQTNHAEAYDGFYARPDLVFTDSEPYRLWRYSMQLSTLDGMKQAVDDAIANNSMVIFYGHALTAEETAPLVFEDYNTYGDDPTVPGSTTNLDGTDHFINSNFSALLTYIDEKVAAGLCKVDTPFNAINSFYKVRKTDLT